MNKIWNCDIQLDITMDIDIDPVEGIRIKFAKWNDSNTLLTTTEKQHLVFRLMGSVKTSNPYDDCPF